MRASLDFLLIYEDIASMPYRPASTQFCKAENDSVQVDLSHFRVELGTALSELLCRILIPMLCVHHWGDLLYDIFFVRGAS